MILPRPRKPSHQFYQRLNHRKYYHFFRFLQLIDQDPLRIGLKTNSANTQISGPHLYFITKLGIGRRTVEVRLPLPKPVHVGTIQDQKRGDQEFAPFRRANSILAVSLCGSRNTICSYMSRACAKCPWDAKMRAIVTVCQSTSVLGTWFLVLGS